MMPVAMESLAGTAVYWGTFLLLGAAFGAVLEMSGFGDTRKLAAQFYFKDLTVLKVMFTGIVVAAVLIGLASAFEILDVRRIWVNPTYLWPGIVGGLIMGVGFIVGGFCPGTSLVAAATLKVDGMFFVGGVLLGVWAFGETVGGFHEWWTSSAMGRFTIPEWLGLAEGVTILALVAMALAMFAGAEWLERRFGEGDRPRPGRWRLGAAGVLVLLAVVAAVKGQPGPEDRWRWMAAEGEQALATRAVLVDPAEIVELAKDLSVQVRFLDVRSETDFNRFHLANSRRLGPQGSLDPTVVRDLLAAPDHVIHFVVSNGEAAAVEAWKTLKAQGVLNLYVLAGGINGWLDRFPLEPCVAVRDVGGSGPDGERLAWRFSAAVGDEHPSASPGSLRRYPLPECVRVAREAAPGHPEPASAPPSPAERKVRLQKKSVAKGGCG